MTKETTRNAKFYKKKMQERNLNGKRRLGAEAGTLGDKKKDKPLTRTP